MQEHSTRSRAPLSVTVQGDPLFTLPPSATNDSHVKAEKHPTKESKQRNSPCYGAPLSVTVQWNLLPTLTPSAKKEFNVQTAKHVTKESRHVTKESRQGRSPNIAKHIPPDRLCSAQLCSASSHVKIPNFNIWNTQENSERQNKVEANKNFEAYEGTGKTISFVHST